MQRRMPTETHSISFYLSRCFPFPPSIYKLHDEVKDKELELELSWVCDESKRLHVLVPEPFRSEAIALAKEAKRKEELDSDDEDDEKKA